MWQSTNALAEKANNETRIKKEAVNNLTRLIDNLKTLRTRAIQNPNSISDTVSMLEIGFQFLNDDIDELIKNLEAEGILKHPGTPVKGR
jgi:hypothetical protein